MSSFKVGDRVVPNPELDPDMYTETHRVVTHVGKNWVLYDHGPGVNENVMLRSKFEQAFVLAPLPKPKVGEVWRSPGGVDYRVLGIDIEGDNWYLGEFKADDTAWYYAHDQGVDNGWVAYDGIVYRRSWSAGRDGYTKVTDG